MSDLFVRFSILDLILMGTLGVVLFLFAVSLRFDQTRRRADRVVKKKEAQLREAQTLARIGSWEWDVVRNTIEWSDELFKIWGIKKENFNPSFESYLQRLDPADRDRIGAIVSKAREEGADFNFEHRITTADGQIRHCQARGRVIKDFKGRIIKMMGTTQDISELKKIEEQLLNSQVDLEKRVLARTAELNESLRREKQAKEDAEAATQAKMQFLANMSHEIRTPMNAVLGFADLLLDDKLSPEQTDFLNRIKSNGGHLLRIIDDILDLSKFEAGQIPIQQSAFSLRGLIDDIVLSLQPSAQRKGLNVEFQYSEEIPTQMISDPSRLQQIIGNLLSNSIKFSDQGVIRIRASISETRMVSIEVEDMGIGILKENQSKLFLPFSQEDGSIARKFGGTGLGLTLSKRIAQFLGGDLILVSSAKGVGSCFRFTFRPILKPVYLSNIVDTSAHQIELSEGKKSDLSAPLLRSVLLVEDSLDNQLLIRHYLPENEFQIEYAMNGFEAVEKGLQNSYDLILMDIQMPGMDGLEATRQLRNKGVLSPIIALTAHALKEEMKKSLDAGCNAHLTKPINRTDLLMALRSYLNQSNPSTSSSLRT